LTLSIVSRSAKKLRGREEEEEKEEIKKRDNEKRTAVRFRRKKPERTNRIERFVGSVFALLLFADD